MTLNPYQTHEVTNQSPPFADINLYETDAALRDAVRIFGAADDGLSLFGARTGSAKAFDAARLANEYPPRLIRFDQKGFPADTVEFHPAYHEWMRTSMEAGLHCSTWESGAPPGAHVARAARVYMTAQVEPGHACPMTMTHACVASLRHQPELAAELEPKICARTYDPAFAPVSAKSAITVGMGMTEKQGGTDVRANATLAEPVDGGGPGGEYVLTGHKWFMSAPMCDSFLMLAQAPGGLSCFHVPRFLLDGAVNPLRLQRLKDKLGNRSNASCEVELQAAHGWLVGEEGRGVATIIDMVTLTRLDCAIASAGQMRMALALALHHTSHRRVFQKSLIGQPLMARVLADMAVDVEAATVLSFRLAQSFDADPADEDEAAWRRLMTPVTKYWVCKMAPALGCEAMECLGGNGYVEEGLAARLYRELPLNAIWEGSGNVMCLDVLRVLTREPEAAGRVFAQIADGMAGDTRLAAALETITSLAADTARLEANARMLVDLIARTAAAALLNANAPDAVSGAFIASRLDGGFHHTYGAGLSGDPGAILDRARPE
ncbi:MAG: acyl-CoA dehydrogenase family protein [Tepidamorphaceae bacterium]